MKRYAETFFRYWLLVLIPIIALPIGEYAMIRHTPKGVLASANIWVDQAPGSAGASYTQWETPAQIEMDTFTQLLQTASFDLAVVQSSPAYRQALAAAHGGAAAVVTDLTTNVKLTTYGSSLLNISYTSKNWLIAQQVVQGILNTVNKQVQQLSQQQSKTSVSYYTYQLRLAQQSAAQSAQRLSSYMSAKGYTALDLQNEQGLDPTLAGLMQQNQQDQAAVSSAQQALAKAQAQANLPASLAGSSNFHVVDPPSLAVVSSKKKDIMNLAIALVVGVLLGGGFVVVRTAQDRSIRYADEVQPLLDLPVLAVVPFNSAFGAQAKNTQRATGKLRPWQRSASA